MNKTFKYIACCLVGVFALLPLQAQNIIRPKIAGPGNLWVNSYNGVLFFGQTDFGTQYSAMPMQLRFYYNSSACKIDYGYGLGFSMGYEMRYREDVIGGVDIESGDGRTDHFTKYGDEYKAPPGVFKSLVRPTFDTYLLTTTDGTKYFFDSAYHRKVTAIEDRNGNRTTFRYQDTLLVEVKDAVGHTITLSYTDGLLTQASATFSPGKYKYEYDGLRRLRKRIDPMGNVTLYDYSRQNKLDEITDANGNKTLIAYDDAGMVSRLKTDVSDKSIRYDGDKTVFIDYTEPNNVYSYYRWDDKGRAIEKVGLCCGIQSTLKYDDNNNIAQRIDANGNATNYTYDEHGNMLSFSDPLGNSEHYTYEPSFNQVASFQDKNGNIYTFSYDTKGNLSALNGPLGFNNIYTYDVHGWQTMVTDANGGVTRLTYNVDGTISSIINPDGGVINYSYDSFGRLSSESDPMGNTTSYIYDNLGHITKEINGLGNATTLTYDKVGNIVRIADARGNITAYTYDALSHITSISDAIGGMYSYEYDGRGNIISFVDPLGIKQQFTYNDRNKVESYTNGEGEKINYDYDNKGNLIAEMRPNGNVISYEYDELDRLTEISDNIGLINLYTYDGNGNQLSVSDGENRTIYYTYDALNRRTIEVLPSGSTTKYNYDNNNNLLTITDAKGSVTSYTYSSMNQQITQVDALNAKTQFEYDGNGNLTRVTDAKGNITTYSYDAIGQNTAITFANGLSLQYTYDELGRIVVYRDRAGRVFKYGYNALGELITKTYPDGSTDKYTYDGIGRMLSAINKDAIISFSYDRAGRILSENLNGKITAYGYDVSSGKLSLTYPSGMKMVEQLNARNLITSILQNGVEVVTLDYNAAGQKISQGFANGISTSYNYNENGWLSSITANHRVMSLEMEYDIIGNVTERRDMLNAGHTESYGYDVISQLTSFKRGTTVNKTYQFDLLGNRVKVIDNGIATNYITNNVNAYSSITGGSSFTPHYDDNGNLLNDDKHTFAYDFNNNLIYIDENTGTYKYDALGRRISENNTLFYYVGDQMVEEVTDNIITSYLYGNNIDQALKMHKNGNDYYYHTDHLSSIRAISDVKGNVIERVEYDIYGTPFFSDSINNNITSSTIGNNILFTGREFDEQSQSYYFRARQLHTVEGRFLQKDPLIYIDGLNDYLYVNNNVLNYIDITGTRINPIGPIGGIPPGGGGRRPPTHRLPPNPGSGKPSPGGSIRDVGNMMRWGYISWAFGAGMNDGYCDQFGRNMGAPVAVGAGAGAVIGGIAGSAGGTSVGAVAGGAAGAVGGAFLGIPGAVAGGVAVGGAGAAVGGTAGAAIGAGSGALTGAGAGALIYSAGYLFGKLHPFGD